jgi:phosphoribosylamine--glycine ligase
MGDPETEAIFPRLKTDMGALVQAIAYGTLDQLNLALDPQTSACIFLVSGGYPGEFKKLKWIRIPQNTNDCNLFFAGVKWEGNNLVTNGGRVIAVSSLGEDIPSALAKSTAMAKEIAFEGKYFRHDIGLDLL